MLSEPTYISTINKHKMTLFLDAISNGNLTSMNAQITDKSNSSSIKSYLNDIPNNVDPAKNPNLSYSLGTNIPEFQLAGTFSFSELQPQNGYLDFCSLIHWGINSQKHWLIVHPKHTWKLIQVVANEIERFRKSDSNSYSAWEKGCCTPLNHKNIVLTPEFLEACDVPYQIVVQEPGSLIYLVRGVYYQVLNIGISFSESVAVGSLLWNIGADLFISCHCKNSSFKYVPRNDSCFCHEKAKSINRNDVACDLVRITLDFSTY